MKSLIAKKVRLERVHETCGAWHTNANTMTDFRLPDGSPLPTDQLAAFPTGVHSRALWKRGDFGA